MAPEFGETQATPQFGSSPSTRVESGPVDVVLPTMADLDMLVSELDAIDEVLAQLG